MPLIFSYSIIIIYILLQLKMIKVGQTLSDNKPNASSVKTSPLTKHIVKNLLSFSNYKYSYSF